MGQVAVTIKGKTVATVGETVILEGLAEFRPSVKYLKWQKWLDGEYVDINIHKSKYKGTKNSVRDPQLVLNDLDLEDGGYYRIKFKCTSSVEYSSVHRLRIQPQKETITIDIQPDQINGRYYVGEDVIIKASLRNVSRILCMTWQKETENGSYTIDTSLEKNMESGNDETGEYILTIRNCNELDRGTYFLLAACTNDMEVKSNRIKLDFVKEKPEVIFKPVPDAVYDSMVKCEASIRSFIKQTSTVWRKGEDTIDINSPKYEGSSTYGCHPILCIKNVNEKDEDIYTIHVSNEWGDTTLNKRLVVIGKEPRVCLKLLSQSQQVAYGNAITLQAEIKSYPVPSCIRWTRKKNGNNEENIDENEKCSIDKSEKSCQKLTIKNLEFSDNGNYFITVTNDLGRAKDNLEIKVEANQMIFISGPVVVSPSDNIKFLTMFTTNQNCLNAKWFKINKYSKKEINFGSTKYSIANTSDGTKTQTFDVVSAGEDDSAGYQLTIDDFRSNVINTFVDDSGKFCTETQGNFFRCFALQTVCADALRGVFDNLPDAFDEKMDKFQKKYPDQLELKNKLKSSSSSKDLDITMMCAIIQNLNYIANPKKGWGREPDKNDIGIADDVERMRNYRNYLCHKASMEMETNDFNKAALDMIWAIRRLSKNDVKMMEDICVIMNQVVTAGEKMDEMVVQIKITQKENNELKDILGIKVPEFNDDIHLFDRQMKFHHVYDSCIFIGHNHTSAFHSSDESGLCFMDRPLQPNEKVHIRGIHQACSGRHLKIANIGLTDINPDTIHESKEKKQVIREALKPVHCIDKHDKQGHYHWWENFHLCITLCPNATLSLCRNDTEETYYHYQTVSDYHPLWLVIELSGFDSIWISHV